ncbi:ATP-binding protein [Streptantibioticus silvisoli]|uniref:ATP-binding protein n=1 Tax=Streptantibioticus silvisoli TaxID=2705255 RepID=A0ABT6W0E5_9ACTN|nr:ATP-binding protein [Streptantibioticus silvisoli]MDI5962991.1 ATP-binding protein [Streptantibioticus silvisoli]
MASTRPRWHTAADDSGEVFPPAGLPFAVGEVDRALVRRLTRELRGGVPVAAAVVGPRGAGRTAFVRRASSLAAQSGMSVLTAIGSPSGSSSPYGLIQQLISALPEDRRPVLPLRGGIDRLPRSALVQSFSRTLLRAAREHPTALVVDDVQWADSGSFEVLCAVLRRLHSSRLSVLISTTGTAPDVAAPCMELLSLICSPSVRGHVLRLTSRFDPTPGTRRPDAGRPPRVPRPREAPGMIGRRPMRAPGGSLPPATVPAPRPAPSSPDPDPTWGLAREPLALLRGLAVCGNLLPLQLVGSVVRLRETSTVSALRTLRTTGLVAPELPVRLTSRVSVERVLSAMDDTERQALHERAAELGHRAALPDEELADLVLGSRPSGAAWVVALLRRVAAACRTRGEHQQAVRCLDRALQEPLSGDERADLLLEIGAASCLTDPDAGDRFLAEVVRRPSRPGGVWRQLTAADLLLARGDAVAARQALAVARAEDPREQESLQAMLWLAGDTQLDTGGLEGMPYEAATLSQHPQDACGAAALAWHAATTSADTERIGRLARTALAFPVRHLPLYPRMLACLALGWAGETDTACAELSVILAEARRRHAYSLSGFVLLATCSLHLRCQDTDRASRDLAMARAEMPISSWHPAVAPLTQALEVRVLLARGEVDAAARTAYGDFRADVEQRFGWLQLRYARGLLHLAQEQPREAAAEFTACGQWLLAKGWTSPALFPWRLLSAVAHAWSGDRAEAVRLVVEGQRPASGPARTAPVGPADRLRAAVWLEEILAEIDDFPSTDLHTYTLRRLTSPPGGSDGPRRQSTGH